jgi:DNA-binding LytR/AlgR family response regulator
MTKISYSDLKIIYIEHKKNYYKIRTKDILYIEKIGKNVYIKDVKRKVDIGRIAIKEIKEKLNGEFFCQANQSTLINIAKVASIENNEFGLDAVFELFLKASLFLSRWLTATSLLYYNSFTMLSEILTQSRKHY